MPPIRCHSLSGWCIRWKYLAKLREWCFGTVWDSEDFYTIYYYSFDGRSCLVKQAMDFYCNSTVVQYFLSSFPFSFFCLFFFKIVCIGHNFNFIYGNLSQSPNEAFFIRFYFIGARIKTCICINVRSVCIYKV